MAYPQTMPQPMQYYQPQMYGQITPPNIYGNYLPNPPQANPIQ